MGKTSKSFWRRKRKTAKKAWERDQNLTKEEKEKMLQYHCEHNKNPF